jgi:hypothetical protein
MSRSDWASLIVFAILAGLVGVWMLAVGLNYI